MRARAALLVLLLGVPAGLAAQRRAPAISSDSLRVALYALAHDSMGGRQTGEIGDWKAQEWIATRTGFHADQRPGQLASDRRSREHERRHGGHGTRSRHAGRRAQRVRAARRAAAVAGRAAQRERARGWSGRARTPGAPGTA